MRHLFVVALGAALLLSGCVVYPLHGYRHQGDGSVYRDYDRRGDRDRHYDRGQARDGYWRNDRGDRP
jgi:hypothetical protein